MTEQDQKEMLAAIGVESVDDLFSDIPESVRFKGNYNIKTSKIRICLIKRIISLAEKNAEFKKLYILS